MIIPGFLIAMLTFPGVIVHEMAHQWFCRRFGLAVLDVCYLRFGNPCGYVVHEHARTPSQSIWISVGPFLINSVLGAAIAGPAFFSVFQFEQGGVVDYFLAWLGVSIAMHAFPSMGDAAVMWKSTRAGSFGVKAVTLPIVTIIYAGALGRVFWLDYIYGLAVAAAIPTLLVRLLA